jgi:hypothetical protein
MASASLVSIGDKGTSRVSDLPFEGLEISPAADNVPPRGRIFLSRSSQDRAVAQKLIPELQALGYEVWAQDKDINIGDSFRLFMDRALKECSATVALLSGDYLKSQWCRDEAVSAHRMDSHILIPLVIEEGLKPDGLIASFVYLDVVVKLSGAPATVARLIAEVLAHGKRLDQSPPAKPYLQHSRYITNIPFDDTALLVGRDAAIEKLDAILNKPGDANAVAVTAGMGGVGKSWLARVYAVRNRMAYRGVWLVRCGKETEIIEDLASLGEELDESLKGKDPTSAARETLRLLRQEAGRRVLLLYDNVENPDFIRDWLPHAGARIILTSRWNDWTGTAARAVPLGALSREAAIALLRDHSPKTSESDANAIAEALGDLPLALSHAAAVLRRSGLNAGLYLRDLSRRLQQPVVGSEYQANVRAAIESNLDQCKDSNGAAEAVLQLAAFHNPTAIPIDLFLTEAARRLLPSSLYDEVSLRETIRNLAAYSLLRVDWHDQARPEIEIHRLVQAVMRDRLGKRAIIFAMCVCAANAALLYKQAMDLPERIEVPRDPETLVRIAELEDGAAISELIIPQVSRFLRLAKHLESLSAHMESLNPTISEFAGDLDPTDIRKALAAQEQFNGTTDQIIERIRLIQRALKRTRDEALAIAGQADENLSEYD